MSRFAIDLFAEDRAHEEFLKALLLRLGREERRSIRVQVRSARGARPAVDRELRLYRKAVECFTLPLPELLVVGMDANCSTP